MAEERNREACDLPIERAEDVEFSRAMAGEEDLEAQQRARAADERQECGGL